MDDMQPLSGTYLLVLHSRNPASALVGRWGRLDVRAGYYLYVGSAFGPGGVRARVSRHCRGSKKKHWHIDYLRDFASPVEVWCSYDSRHLEHRWAGSIQQSDNMAPIEGFGCSDCECRSHLFFTSRKPELSAYANVLGGDVQACRLGG